MTNGINYRSEMGAELVQSWGSDEMIARAARVSTGSDLIDNPKIKGLIKYLYRSGHSSPFEHCGATFRLEVPLFVRDQIVRHRTFSYNIKSFRFGEAEPEFYLPGSTRPLKNEGSGAHPNLQPGTSSMWFETVNAHRAVATETWKAYRYLLKSGIAEEVARNVLPTGLYTSMYMTGDLWNWFGFLNKRIESENNKPQWEVEQVALGISRTLAELFPVAFEAYQLDTAPGEQ